MKDLTHWDFEDEFTAKEAALLIRGLDPNESDIPDTDPILCRIRSAYEAALLELQIHHDSTLEQHTETDRQVWLASLDPTYLHCAAMTVTDERLYFEWMYRRMGDNLDAQKFSRTELARWLDAIGKKSEYPFDPALPRRQDASASIEHIRQTIKAPKKPDVADRINGILNIAGTLGYKLPDLPQRIGKNPGPKAQIRKLALKNPGLFTESTFNSAWTKASKDGLINDSGVKRN